MGLEPRREKRESCITCRRMLGMTPFFPPKLGGKPYLEKDSLFGHSLFRVLLHRIHGDNVIGNYNVKFLEAIDFAFKKCHFTFVPKAEQLQAIHAVVTGNDGFVKPATGFGKVVPLNVCDFLRSESDVNCKSVLLIVSPNRGRSDGSHTKVWNFVPETQLNSCMMLAQKNNKF